MTCGVDNRLVHEEPEAHAPRSRRAVHLPRDKERSIPGTPDVLSGNLRKVEYARSKDLGFEWNMNIERKSRGRNPRN